MEFGLRITFFLLLVIGTGTVKGFSVLDAIRGSGGSSGGPKSIGGDPKPSKPAGGNDFGLNLEDALHPAANPTDNKLSGDNQGNVIQKLDSIIENQNEVLRLLRQLTARPQSRFL